MRDGVGRGGGGGGLESATERRGMGAICSLSVCPRRLPLDAGVHNDTTTI